VINSSSTTLDHISGQGPAVLREGGLRPPLTPLDYPASNPPGCTEVVVVDAQN
jgi:hypothetical protein